jgi:hypothetical protein
MLNSYKKALYLFRELKNQDVHVAVKEKYVIDREGNKTDCIIEYIAYEIQSKLEWLDGLFQAYLRKLTALLIQTRNAFFFSVLLGLII